MNEILTIQVERLGPFHTNEGSRYTLGTFFIMNNGKIAFWDNQFTDTAGSRTERSTYLNEYE